MLSTNKNSTTDAEAIFVVIKIVTNPYHRYLNEMHCLCYRCILVHLRPGELLN